MKKTIILFALILCGQTNFAQNNNLSETEKLATTAKIWGFLKYYHPEVANGKFNWDEQLFEILPKVRKSETKEELSRVYLDWINDLGEVKECRKCKKISTDQYFDENIDLGWLDNNAIFTAELSENLRYIENNRHQGKKHYVSSVRGTQQIEITNEDTYDENFRAGLKWWAVSIH